MEQHKARLGRAGFNPEHLQKVLARLQEDFGREKLMFKQPLLGNPPNIQL